MDCACQERLLYRVAAGKSSKGRALIAPVCVWVAVTVTPGRTPPDWSVTSPLICAVACAQASAPAVNETDEKCGGCLHTVSHLVIDIDDLSID